MRRLRWLVVPLLVLVVLLVVADRVGAWAAERTVADQVAAELGDNRIDSEPPRVDIAGVPFLTQVGSGRYERVTVVLKEVGVSAVTLSEVELVATGVTAPLGTLVAREGAIDAERVDGTATVGYRQVAGLSGLDGLELGGGPDGAMTVRLDSEVLGAPVRLSGTAQVSLDGGLLLVRAGDLTVEGSDQLPPGAEQLVAQVVADAQNRLSLDVELPALPYDLTIESVEPAEAGLVVRASAENVPLAR